jgi:hypothetical protein
MGKKLLSFTMATLLFIAIKAPTLTVAKADENMPAMDMAAMVESAKTPADHEALAKMYDDEGAKATKLAAEHDKMAKSYSTVQRLSEMASHCQRLASYYKSAAEDYKAMAIMEREQTKAAP